MRQNIFCRKSLFSTKHLKKKQKRQKKATCEANSFDKTYDVKKATRFDETYDMKNCEK